MGEEGPAVVPVDQEAVLAEHPVAQVSVPLVALVLDREVRMAPAVLVLEAAAMKLIRWSV